MNILLSIAAFAPLLAAGSAQTLTQGERDRAMSELHATRKQFLDEVEHLSDAQWDFKPDDKTWSIAECAEHIAVSEDQLFAFVTQKLMQSPAAPEKKEQAKGKDEAVLRQVPDRTHKFQAPEFLRPTHRWPTRQELVDHFRQSSDRTIAYIESTQDDLRSHFMENPILGQMDAYQWILYISAHSQRHIEQIREVKRNPNFPGN